MQYSENKSMFMLKVIAAVEIIIWVLLMQSRTYIKTLLWTSKYKCIELNDKSFNLKTGS